MKLTASDIEQLRYLGSFKSGACWTLPGEEPSWKRLASAGYVTLEARIPKRGRRYRQAAALTDAGRAFLATLPAP